MNLPNFWYGSCSYGLLLLIFYFFSLSVFCSFPGNQSYIVLLVKRISVHTFISFFVFSLDWMASDRHWHPQTSSNIGEQSNIGEHPASNQTSANNRQRSANNRQTSANNRQTSANRRTAANNLPIDDPIIQLSNYPTMNLITNQLTNSL